MRHFDSAQDVDFDVTRAAFRESLPGRAIARIATLSVSAWRTASFGNSCRRIANDCRRMAPAMIVRRMSIALAIAALMHPALARLMPLTVKPAMPAFVYAVVAALAAIGAWRADAIVTSWRSSRFARLLR